MSRTPLLLAALTLAANAPAEDVVRFNRDIRPIMSDTCFHCHGFDPKSRKGDLRLDIREEALKAGKSGETAIVPGKPEQSEIIKRIFSEDPDDVMPSKEAHKTLTPAQKELFRRWVAQGAQYEPHWAYMPLSAPKLPAMPEGGRNAIDAFIGEKLAAKGIRPSPEARPETLLRRVSLDLTGLPPTPEETAAFLADKSPDAYEKQVDRLLASPRFGERMAVWWLDVARYADTVGFHGDQNQRIFPYRDYVIQAFNANKPFDAFTREQIAGDLLPDRTEEQLIASGYNRLNMMTREGGAQAKEYLAKYGAERVRSVSAAWLGSTFGCAECHDHKFDPISQKDFYSLQAFFADVKQWGVYADYVYTPEPELKGVGNDHPFFPEAEVNNAFLQRRDRETRAAIKSWEDAWLSGILKDAGARKSLEEWKAGAAAFLSTNPDGWNRPSGEHLLTRATAPAKAAPKKDSKAKTPTVTPPSPTPFTAGGLVQIPKGLGRDEQFHVTLRPSPGTYASLRIDVPKEGNETDRSALLTPTLMLRDAKGRTTPLAFAHGHADRREARFVGGTELSDVTGGWKFRLGTDLHAVWTLDRPVTVKEGDSLLLRLNIDSKLTLKVGLSPFAAADARTVAVVRSVDEQGALLWLHSAQPDRASVERHRKMAAELRAYNGGKTSTMVTQSVKPLTVRVLPRGNFLDESGPVVLPATPSFLPGRRDSSAERRLDRRDLAEWIVSKDNPITARTVMNRMWQLFHGAGLTVMLDDLGSQGEPPSHPELLDWLALEFRDKGWDIKRMVRLLVTSRTYRQSSSLRPELKDVDPSNRLLASQNPRRLDAEFVRDNALFVAGLLDTSEIGGPSAKPYQPAGHYEPLQFPNRTYVPSEGREQWRRGLYMHWQRMFLHPMLVNFDAPVRDECSALRNYSNTPQQALTLLNDPTFVEAARALAARLLAAPEGTDRLDRAFRLAVGRPIRPGDRAPLEKLIADQTAHYRAQPDDAAKLLKVGIAPVPRGDPAVLAAWTNACRAVLNSHEAITRY